MKLTVTQWTIAQNRTPDTDDGNALYDKIETRTFGKRWSQEVAIRLDEDEQAMLSAALTELDEPTPPPASSAEGRR